MVNFSKLKFAYDQLGWFDTRQDINDDVKSVLKEVKKLIREFMVDNEPVKKGTFNLWDYTATDELRLVLNGILHDKEFKFAVATNAHIMVADADSFDESKVDTGDEFDGRRPVDRYGKFIDGRFPNWHAIIPEDNDGYTTCNIPLKEIDEYIKKCNAYMKIEGWTGRSSRNPVYQVPGTEAWFNAHALRKFLLATGGEINIIDPARAACYWSEKRQAIIMPILFNKEWDMGDGIYLAY